MAIPDWSPSPPSWSKEMVSLLSEEEINEVPNVTLKSIIKRSKAFPIKFPIRTGTCETLQKYITTDILERNINSAYPVIHEKALELCCKFILFKRKHGSTVEKDYYKQMTLKAFINRLLTKRAVTFVGCFDHYLLLNGKDGFNNWELIGTDTETAPLILKDCLSYDEIKCSVFLSVSSYTYFVNRGDRRNRAVYSQDRSNIQDEGIIIGLIGPRLVKNHVMEYQDMVFTDKQNTNANGYGTTVSDSLHRLFSDFYEEPCFDFEEVSEYKQTLPINDKRYTTLTSNCIFDNHIYYKRLTLSIDTLFVEANHRAQVKGTTAFIHVVGLGLGVWKISSHQEGVYIETFAQRIKYLGPKLSNISDICFSYINQEKCGEVKNGQIFPINDHPENGIRIHFRKNQPHEKLENPDQLLVVSYAWDGNALPGNEYWDGGLDCSSDSAAASSTQIVEIHNPHINPLVTADNLKVVTKDGIVSIEKYIEDVKCEINK